ncbi:MAG: hypothetical protein WCJ24_01290 [Candidatus Saccharibacteria bacterium]
MDAPTSLTRQEVDELKEAFSDIDLRHRVARELGLRAANAVSKDSSPYDVVVAQMGAAFPVIKELARIAELPLWPTDARSPEFYAQVVEEIYIDGASRG